MPWKRSKSDLAHDFPDLAFVPRGKSAWDCTLAGLAYGVRMDIPQALPDLNAWAARHGIPGSKLYETLGDAAMVLWHGTSRQRAEKITEHGLFHKRGLWAARHPNVPHSFCRMRSDRFGTEGAMVCLVLDRTQLTEGRDFQVETNGNIVRFHHGLPPDVVQYVLIREEIRYAGSGQASESRPWPGARFKHSSGQWLPLQRSPVRFSESQTFSTLPEYERLCICKILNELNGASPLEVLSALYSLVTPWESLRHGDILELLESLSSQTRSAGKWKLFLPDKTLEVTP